ncbi:hypothetical protein TNCV_111151 [Trichonephila clavipes]|nr:hypothetical protein TNCV_111151 [Trichonephila clavipes]
MSSASSTEVLAAGVETWGFLEVLGLVCWRAAAFLARCSQKFTLEWWSFDHCLGGLGSVLVVFLRLRRFRSDLISWVSGATQKLAGCLSPRTGNI